MSEMILAEGLEKTYQISKRRGGLWGGLRSVFNPEIHEVQAVNDLNLRIERGEMISMIGPNGAGKSTTIKMLTGILMPSRGNLRVAGLVPIQDRRQLAAKIGVVFGQRSQLWWDLPLIDSLQLLQHLYRVPAERFQRNLALMKKTLALPEFMHTPVRQLSLGQRMRGDLAAALLHEPELLYLDEPTIGLDVVAKASVRDFLRTLNQTMGTTILLTTHDLDDVEALCQRMVIIDHGRKLYDGTVESIRERFAQDRLLLVDFEGAALPVAENGLPEIEMPEGVSVIRYEHPRLWLQFRKDVVHSHELISWLGERYRLKDISFQETDIEEVIRRIYEKGLLL